MRRFVLVGLGWLLLALAIAALIWDVVSPDTPGGTAAAQAGFRIGSVIGVVLRTLVLVGVAALLLRRGREGAPPPARESLRAEMERALKTHRERIPAVRPGEADHYEGSSDADLVDVYQHIDRTGHPGRFAAVLWVMSERVRRS
jgi:hypothetical protein